MTDPEQNTVSKARQAQKQALAQWLGRPAWLSIIASCALLALFVVNTILAIQGLYPLWLATLVAIMPIHAGFTVLHEASHKTLSNNAKGMGWIDPVLGTAHAALLVYDLPTFRFLHLRHHRFTNDAQADPDYWLQLYPLPLVILLSFAVPLHYLRLYLGAARKGELTRHEIVLTSLRLTLLLGLAIALMGIAPLQTLMLWLLPSAIASALISVSHRMLHAAEATPDRIRTTKIIRGQAFWEWLICPFFWLNNHHLIHHENPRLPVIAHGALYAQIEDELAARGAKVVKLGAGKTKAADPGS